MISLFKNENAWLSNFAPAKVTFDGMEYPSVEHAYQAAKTLDYGQRLMIARTPLAVVAKKMGKSVTMRSDWLQVRVAIMQDLLKQKFAIPMYHDLLLSTKDEELVEGNWWHDTFWGCFTCYSHKGSGANWLGRLLMGIRSDLGKSTF